MNPAGLLMDRIVKTMNNGKGSSEELQIAVRC